jgi:hypothetical protein
VWQRQRQRKAIANLPRLSDGAVTNRRAAVLAVAGVASRQCGVRSGKAIGRPNHFHFHIFFLEIKIDTIVSETNTALIFR